MFQIIAAESDLDAFVSMKSRVASWECAGHKSATLRK